MFRHFRLYLPGDKIMGRPAITDKVELFQAGVDGLGNPHVARHILALVNSVQQGGFAWFARPEVADAAEHHGYPGEQFLPVAKQQRQGVVIGDVNGVEMVAEKFFFQILGKKGGVIRGVQVAFGVQIFGKKGNFPLWGALLQGPDKCGMLVTGPVVLDMIGVQHQDVQIAG